jgi:hypothetical protein
MKLMKGLLNHILGHSKQEQHEIEKVQQNEPGSLDLKENVKNRLSLTK